MLQKLTDTDIYMLEKLCIKYGKKSFSLEDVKKYLIQNENFTDIDFSTSWNHLFKYSEKGEPIGYIARECNNDFKLLHKGLLYSPKPKEKQKWTHTEIISVISVCSTVIITLLNIIFK